MIERILARYLHRRGYGMVPLQNLPHVVDLPREFLEIYERCRHYTQTSIERMYAVYNAIDYLVAERIPGDIVECGVWRGGSAMVAALALMAKGDESRTLWLYDTYEGMPKPRSEDVDHRDSPAFRMWERGQRSHYNKWNYAPLEGVRANLAGTGYPGSRISFVRGLVEETIPSQMPNAISLLHLDTDFYESTRHELTHLYPRLSNRGVLIIDDYGHFKGAKKAVDEHFAGQTSKPFLNRIDYTGRLVIKFEQAAGERHRGVPPAT